MKILLRLLVLLALSAAVYFFVFNRSSSTFDKDKTQFSIENVESINRISITDHLGRNADLKKTEDGRWTINGRYFVRKDAIDFALEAIEKTRVYSTVPKNAYDNIMKMMTNEPRKVEIYTNDGLEKTIIMSGNTQNKQGTYMMLEGSDEPYITHIPSFMGFLHRRFFTKVDEWRTREVFDVKSNEIKKFSIEYFHKPQSSFSIEQSGGEIKISNPNGLGEKTNVNKIKAAQYLTNFVNLNLENFENLVSFKDSVIAIGPMTKMLMEEKSGKTTEVLVYPMGINERTKSLYDKDGTPLKFDMDRYYASMNEGRDFVIIQSFVFDKIFVEYDEFFKNDL